MRIAAVETYLLSTPIPAKWQVESGAGRKLARQMCLIRVRTDDGLEGIGSPSGPYDLQLLDRIVQTLIAPKLLGCDAREIEHIWHRVYYEELLRNVGSRGIGIAALSGIDIALWDLKSRAAGMPLYDVLGGRYHRAGLRAYASSIYWDLSPDAASRQARRMVADGFSAVKLKVGREPRRDADRVRAIREAVGPDVAILVDANQALGRMEALAMLPVLEEAAVYWFEEPLPIDDVEGHRMLRSARRTVRIATGENLYTRFDVMRFVEAGAVDVIQADASRVGGVSEARRIAALAAAHHLEWNPHTFNDILTVAANLHLVTATAGPAMFEWDVTHNALMDRLSATPLRPVAGRLHAPDAPGLGVEIDWDFVHRSQWTGEPAIGPGHGLPS